jgi:hypothetical protein
VAEIDGGRATGCFLCIIGGSDRHGLSIVGIPSFKPGS